MTNIVTVRHGFAMAHLYIDGLPNLIAMVDLSMANCVRPRLFSCGAMTCRSSSFTWSMYTTPWDATRRVWVKIAEENWREEENFWPGCLRQRCREYDGIWWNQTSNMHISQLYIWAVVSNMHSSLGPLKSPAPADGEACRSSWRCRMIWSKKPSPQSQTPWHAFNCFIFHLGRWHQPFNCCFLDKKMINYSIWSRSHMSNSIRAIPGQSLTKLQSRDSDSDFLYPLVN